MRLDLPSGHVALLMTDIEGSTRLLHKLGAEGYARAQAEHRDVLRQAFTTHGGVEVDTQGDAFFYAFPDTAGCASGAVAGTRALATFPFTHGEAIKVRMGMHAGEPQPTEEGYVGLVVNLAARVAAIGHGGQVLLSADAAAEALEPLSAGDITLRDLGEHRLKDIEAPEHLYQLVIPELPADFPPPRSAETRPSNLPVPLTPFIGRAKEVAEVRDLLSNPQTRAVTLLGPGGTGKSRLSLRVAEEMIHAMPDGAFFVALAAIREVDLVLPAIAGALEVREEPGRPLLESLKTYLADRSLLLVMDNFEQVSHAARDVGQLQAASPGLKILTSSRQPLRLSGERIYPVPPLGLPGPNAPLDDLNEIAGFEAVRLFVERAQGAQWDFELSTENVADVVEICRQLDALPLAIELATARLYSMSTTDLLKALKNRLAVLTGGSADLLDHQQTLKDLVAWSYDLLDEREQVLWRRLAVFDGGAPLPAVGPVCDPDDAYFFPLDLDSLVNKSLLTLSFDGSSLEDEEDDLPMSQRVNMLQTLRDYAQLQLKQSGELPEITERHARWFAAHAERAAPNLRGADASGWLSRLDRDQTNFRNAMSWGLKNEPALAANTAGVLWFHWYQRGQFSEGREWLEKTIATDATDAAKARSLLGLANLERIQNNIEQSRAHCEAALTAFEASGDEEGTADALSQLGTILQYLGEFEEAENRVTAAVEKLRLLSSRGRLSFSLVVLGALKQRRDELDDALEHYQEGLALGRELADANYIATGLVNVGEVQAIKGELEQAAANIQESLALFNALGVRNAIAYCLEMLADIELRRERFLEAARLFGAADRLRELLNTPVESFNQARYKDDLARTRSGAGDVAFDTEFEAGRSMRLDDVIAQAQTA
jgi:predicted ATPase/class 3 adenylate cyclase